MRGATELQRQTLVWIGATMLICLTASRVCAFTCEDVRSLSTAQQNYWSQRLHLSASQRHVIWVACYQKYRAPELRVAHR